jgi:putative oxidoreductase
MLTTLARPMLSAIFISGGIEALKDPQPEAQMSEDVGPPIAGKIGLPEEPELLVKINGGVQVGAGALLALGRLPRLSAFALACSLVPTTIAGHAFWDIDDPEAKAGQQMHFLKNVGLLGGLLLAMAGPDTEVVEVGGDD